AGRPGRTARQRATDRVVREAARLAKRVSEAHDAAHVLTVVLPRLNGVVRERLPRAWAHFADRRRDVRWAVAGRGMSFRLHSRAKGNATHEHEEACSTSHDENLLKILEKPSACHELAAAWRSAARRRARTVVTSRHAFRAAVVP